MIPIDGCEVGYWQWRVRGWLGWVPCGESDLLSSWTSHTFALPSFWEPGRVLLRPTFLYQLPVLEDVQTSTGVVDITLAVVSA